MSSAHEKDQFDPDADYEPDSMKRFEYPQVFFLREDQDQTWISMSDSFYRAAKYLIANVVRGSLFEDIEGRAALFLSRHYLELVLKRIVLAGRYLSKDGGLTKEEIEPVANIHDLTVLCKWALIDAKPKMPKTDPWEDFDWEFAEKCITEFANADPKGFAFRYHGQGGEKAFVNYVALEFVLDHTHSVLETMLTVLIETRGEILDWLDEQASW